ncbi:endonuclease/exonuclease/phosphatase family protein [Sanguibacter keddieii]|uniref:endonuclease/exonuclease/phosphatase family protein n=1 Tax=Sanguibacter keddieii TaxID=60920 RepID=UPI0003265FD2|nr:endonuclease/exonuclease/phosphatase family protein [Sanguibacter keddieii]
MTGQDDGVRSQSALGRSTASVPSGRVERTRALGWIAVVVVAMAAVLSLATGVLGWSGEKGIAQVVALRTWLLWGFASMAVVALLTALVIGSRGRRPARTISVALVCALAAGSHLLVLDSRGLDAGLPLDAADERDGDITVLTANVRGERAGEETVSAIVDLIISSGADVVALPEGQPVVDEVVAQLIGHGESFQSFPAFGAGPNRGTALLVAESLGTYREVDGPVGGVRVVPVDGDGPPIAAVHPTSLPPDPTADLGAWRSEGSQLRALFRTMTGGIVAGDMNATLDHQQLRETGTYVDAGSAAGIGGYGTFPSSLPGVLGTAIDHVLVDRGRFTVRAGAVVDVPGTDHRAVVVRVAQR